MSPECPLPTPPKLYIFVTHDILRTYMFFDHGGGGSLGFLTFFLNQVTYRALTLGKFRGDQLKKNHPVYTFK